MNKLAIVFAVGAATLLGGSAVHAADYSAKAKGSSGVSQQSTDMSSQRRHYRQYGYRYAPRRAYYARPGYYAPRAYYGRPYGYGPGYGYGGPVVSFGFGGGGLGFGHHHRGW